MGCEFNFEELRAQNKVDAKAEVEEIIERAAYEYGHGGYSGSFAEAFGTTFDDSEMKDVAAAEAYLMDHAEKWGAAVIVKTKDGHYCVGAACSS